MKNDELIHRVSLFLDNELNQDEAQNLMDEIRENKQYQSLLHQEQSFKTYRQDPCEPTKCLSSPDPVHQGEDSRFSFLAG